MQSAYDTWHDATADAWIEPFLDEICLFPAGRYKDQTDAASRAFAELLKMTKVHYGGSDLGIGVVQVDRGPDGGDEANDGFPSFNRFF